MRKRTQTFLVLSSLLRILGLSTVYGQDSQVRSQKELSTEFVLDAPTETASDVQIQEEPGTILEDLEELDPVGDWLSQFAWYRTIERFLPGLILLGLLLGKVAKYTPGRQDDLISGGMVLLGRLLQRKKPSK